MPKAKQKGRGITYLILQALTPDCVFNTIYEITPDFLCKRGIHGALIDIDGTAASHRTELPEKQLHHYIASLQQAGIRAAFLSNNHAARVKKFSEAIGIPFISRAVKPLPFGFRKGAAVLRLPMKEIAVIGDQIFTDIYGANRAGIHTVLVHPIHPKEEIQIVLKRYLEKIVLFFYHRQRSRTGIEGEER